MSKMKVPGWGTTVGIIMICLSALGIFGKLYSLLVITSLKYIANMAEISEYSSIDAPGMNFGAINETFILMMYAAVGIGAIVSVVGLIAGIRLLSLKKGVVQFAQAALIASLVVRFLIIGYLYSTGTVWLVSGLFIASLIAILADGALLIVVGTSDKSAYLGERSLSEVIIDDIDEVPDL